MDSIATLVQGIQDLTAAKFVLTCAVALTLYDYSLMFGDEIEYVWRGRKSWVSYLYIANRILLMVFQFWEIYYFSNPRNSETDCVAGYYIQVLFFTFFFLSSDVFIGLRIYAITFKNRVVAAYFGALMLARFATSLALSIFKPPVYTSLPSIPDVDAFNMCWMTVDLKLMLIPNAIGTTFELSAFLVIVWYTYRNKTALKFSALVRTIVMEATIYFLVIVAMQTYVQLSLSLMEGITQSFSFFTYGVLNAILTMRFVLSLKRSADPARRREWRSVGFSEVAFAGVPAIRVSVVRENIEMDPVDYTNP